MATSGWSGINTGSDTGDQVEAKLGSAFSNVDLEIDKIGVLTADIALLQNPEKTIYKDMTGIPPVYAAGQMYYADGMWNMQSEYSDVTLQVGRETHLDVINNSGAEIPNGSALRYAGVVAGVIQVVLAKADNFQTSSILGVATHNIPDGSHGIMTREGFVGDFDNVFHSDSATPLTGGLVLYLSDTVAGKYTNTAPDIISTVGGVTLEGTNGALVVGIVNIRSLPTIYSNMNGGTLPVTLTQNIPSVVTNFTDEDDRVMPSNIVAGLISVPATGRYRASVNIHLHYDQIGNTEQHIDCLIEANDSTDQRTIHIVLPRNSVSHFASFNTSMGMTKDKDYHLKITSLDSNLTTVVAVVEFDIESIDIR